MNDPAVQLTYWLGECLYQSNVLLAAYGEDEVATKLLLKLRAWIAACQIQAEQLCEANQPLRKGVVINEPDADVIVLPDYLRRWRGCKKHRRSAKRRK